MKKYLFVLLAMFSLSALAGKPVSGAVWLADPANPYYGDVVTLGVETYGVKGDALTSVRCFQGGATVYFNRHDPEHKYTLSNEADHSWNWDGNAASCRATLGHCFINRGSHVCETLDYIEFLVSGN